MYEKLLKDIGLTDGETSVYLSLLEIGSSTVGPIVKKSGIAYSNIYDVLNRLIDKGLVSFIIKSKTKYFQALAPNRLLDLLKKQETKIIHNKHELEKAMPKLTQLQSLAEKKQEAEIFVGWKGVKTAFERILDHYKKPEEYLFTYKYNKKTMKRVDTFFNQLDPLYRKKKVKFRGISSEPYKTKSWFLKQKAKDYTKMRYTNFQPPSNIEILNDIVLLTTWSDTPICFWIQSQELSDNFKEFFEVLWKQAKK